MGDLLAPAGEEKDKGMKKPLNGGNTRPLSKHALGVLLDILKRGEVEAYSVNPGVRDRLYREDLVQLSHRPRRDVLIITDAGKAALRASNGQAK